MSSLILELAQLTPSHPSKQSKNAKAADGGQVHLRLDLLGVLNLARDEDLEREHGNDHLKAPNPSSTPVMTCLSSLFLSVLLCCM